MNKDNYSKKELIKAKEKAEISEARFRQVSEVAQVLIWEVDSNGLYTYVSPVIESLLGYAPEEVEGKKYFYDLFIPEKREEFKQAAFEFFTKRELIKNFENPLIHKNGHLVYVETTGSPIFVDGNFRGYRGVDIDITERKKAEDKLRESESRFRKLYEYGPNGMVLADSDFKFLMANQAFCQMTGYKEEELKELTIIDITHPGDIAKNVAKAKKMKSREVDAYRMEKRYIKKNGQTIWVNLSVSPFYDSDNQFQYYIGVVSDITQRKKAEEENTEIRQRFELISQHIPGVIYQFQLLPDGTLYFPYASPGIYDIYGVNPEDVEHDATAAFSALHPDDLEQVRASINHSAQTLTPWHDIYRVNHPSGKTKWVEGNSTPEKLDDGSIIWHGYIQDITERKKAEEQLKLYIRALEASSVSVVITDANGVVEYVNPFFTKITGYTLEEVRGENPRILKSGKQNQAFYEDLWNTLKSGKDWSGEFQNKKKNGELFWEKAVISPIKSADMSQITHFVAIKEDITELLEKEDQLKQSLKEKEVLLAEIHHRVKNNLAVVSGMMQLQSFDEENPEVQEKLSDSISRIKTIAKIHEKLYQHETFSSVDLSENIRELTHENVNSLSAGKTIEVEVSLEQVQLNINEAVPCSLIVNEVLVNALKHAFINEEAGNISVDLSAQENQVQITITDNGIGLPEDFSPKNQSSGTKIIQVLTEQLEGEYRYKRIKTGTEFTLTFEKTAIKDSLSTLLY